MTLSTIAANASGLSVRTKLNEMIQQLGGIPTSSLTPTREFVYKTNDSLNSVLQSGYFSSAGVDADSIIEVQFSNGTSKKVRVNADGSVDLHDSPIGLSNGNAARFEALMTLNSSSLNILVHSDSTGNEDHEFVRKITQEYADRHPAYTVLYRLWDDVAGSYASAVTVQTGTGANTLTVYNFANPGKQVEYIQGSRYVAACQSIPRCDLVYINHSHNMGTISSRDYATRLAIPRFLAAMADIARRHVGCGFVLIAQNPRMDSEFMTPWVDVVYRVAAITGSDVADAHSLIINRGKNASLYTDSTHVNSAGSDLTVKAIRSLHRASAGNPAPYSLTVATNLISNGDFSSFGSSVPDNFTLTTGAVTKDTSVIGGKNGYSVRIDGTNGRITWSCPSYLRDELKGQYITLLARVYIPTGQPQTAGIIATASSSNSSNNYPSADQNHGQWHWRSVTHYVDPADTYLQVRLYGDISGTGVAYFDRVILCKGIKPIDCR